MPFFKKLKEIFSDRQGAAEKRVSALIAQQCDWNMIESLVFPEKGVGPRVSAVVEAVIASKNWKLLTPLAARTGDWLGVIDLVYRKNETGPVPPGRAQELEEIYQALKAAPKYGAKLAQSFVTNVENWSCLRNAEACFDWARGKPEFGPVQPVGLVALADNPVEGNRLAMKVLSSPAEIDRAVDAVEWFYQDKSGDRDAALDNLGDWRKKLEEAARPGPPEQKDPVKRPPPAPFRP